MKKIYHLSTCSTNQRILKELNPKKDVELQDIKTTPITVKQIEEMKQLAGSYEALFSKRAQLYKSMDLKSKQLTDDDYKQLILEHYTFLKRPVIIIDDAIFIGNSKKVIEQVKQALN